VRRLALSRPLAAGLLASCLLALPRGALADADPGENPIDAPNAGEAPSGAEARSAADAAYATLRAHVARASHPEALRSVILAYHNYRAANPSAVRKPYLFFVDLGLDNRTPRGWVFDMDRMRLVEGPFHVSHGRGSSPIRDAIPARFSNTPGSHMSSLGVYLAQETYAFSGRMSGRAYRSVGLRMRGESGRFNNAARRRGIVAHGAPYVSGAGAGRSEGCPAMEQERADRLLPRIANGGVVGGVVIVYSPNDRAWLSGDPWLNAAAR